MSDLADFLLARIAQDSFVAFNSQDDEALLGPVWEPLAPEDHRRPHAANWGPARVLAECEAKRQIVAMVPDLEGVLAALALPYADHPDYREEWRA